MDVHRGAAAGPVEVGSPPARGAELSARDLAELMAAFNEVTAKLHESHERLQGEVARLHGELQAANAQLERSRRLAALGEMAAGISHEVRNPLGSIRLYARMLEEDLRDRPTEREVAGKIQRAATALDGIVGDVLSFAREFRPDRGRLVAREVFERAVEACDPRSNVAWRGIEVVLGGDLGLVFEGDAGLVQQALVNVVRNAMEAIVEGGPTGRVTLAASWEADGVVLAVRDTGPGVTPEVVSRMFNPFFTTRGTGTGLGLAIVHRIVDAHGGVVRVRNNSERAGGGARGASVELVFPRGGGAERGLAAIPGAMEGSVAGAPEGTSEEQEQR